MQLFSRLPEVAKFNYLIKKAIKNIKFNNKKC